MAASFYFVKSMGLLSCRKRMFVVPFCAWTSPPMANKARINSFFMLLIFIGFGFYPIGNFWVPIKIQIFQHIYRHAFEIKLVMPSPRSFPGATVIDAGRPTVGDGLTEIRFGMNGQFWNMFLDFGGNFFWGKSDLRPGWKPNSICSVGASMIRMVASMASSDVHHRRFTFLPTKNIRISGRSRLCGKCPPHNPSVPPPGGVDQLISPG